MRFMKRTKTSDHHKEVDLLARLLGERIRVARVRRKLRQEDLAAKTNLSRSTIQAIERGSLTCSVGALLLVLWNMGLSDELALIADPGLDDEGLTLALTAEGKRVRVRTKIDNDF
jgi:transcriptional regulator with XRE-family HTH domain